MHCENARNDACLLVSAEALVLPLEPDEPHAASGSATAARRMSLGDRMPQWYATGGYTAGTGAVTAA
jgi:hypothetical protein